MLRGQPLDAAGLDRALRDLLAGDPLAQVLILPSGSATTQALITVMDVATRAGVQRLRVIRLEARP